MLIVGRSIDLAKYGAAVMAVVASAGCAHFDCARVTGDAALQIDRISGGDGPHITIVEVFSSGHLRFQILGHRSYCGRISADEVRTLLALADSKHLQSLQDVPLGFHEPSAQIERDGVRIRVPLGELPSSLVPLFQRVDSTFGAAFGRQYDQRLLPDRGQ